jgi:transcriptional regulator with XRE-family HTH domain
MTTDWLEKILSPEEIIESHIRAQVAMVLQDFRRNNEYSQKDLAKLFGITQGLISRWENAEENLTIGTLSKISTITGAIITIDLPEEIAI